MKEIDQIKLHVVQESSGDWIFEQRENQKHHSPYEWEQIFFESIREGNLDRLDQMIRDLSKTQLFVGKLSSNDLRQAQYLAVAFITLATRSAIQGGMFEMDAYNKSDSFIQTIDSMHSSEEVLRLTLETMRKITAEMVSIRIRHNYHPAIKICLEYIYQNLHSKINLKILAGKCNLSKQYLSVLFRKEVGINLSTYILHEKIKAAKSMMVHSAMSVEEISNYLEFSSQSYFINCFKRECGMTPNAYIRQG